MKTKYFFTLISLLFFINMSFAQVKSDKKDDTLLTQQQVEKVNKIHEKFRPKLKKVIIDKNLSQEQKSKALRKLRAEEQQAYKKVLSPEQVARFKELKEK